MRYLFLTALLASGFAAHAADIILPSSLTVLPGDQVRFRVMLAQPAPSGGVFLTLSSSDTSKFTVRPGAILIAETQTTSPVDVVLTAQDFGAATLTASAPGLADASQTVRVGSALGFSPPNLIITGTGATQNLILNLGGPAPASGLNVALSSTNPSVATVAPAVTFPANVSSLIVPVTSVGPGSTVIHASAPPSLPDTTATVNVVTSGNIGLPSNVNVPTGSSVPFPVTLGTSAPPGGVVVTLTSSDSARISVSPSAIFIPQGATPTIQPQLTAFNIGTVTITASAPGYATAVQSVQGTATVTFSPSAITITGTASERVLLSLSSAAPPGTSGAGRCDNPDPSICSITVKLSSDNPAVAQVQPSLSYFPDGSSQAINQIPIVAVGVGTTLIHAGAQPYIPDTTLTVTVVGAGGPETPGAIVLPAISTLAPGQSAVFPISLSTPAPAGGVNVALTSTVGSKVAIGPASVFVAAGNTMPATQPQITGLAAGSSTIGASAPGYTPASQLVQVGVSLSFSPASVTIPGTGTSNLQLNLSARAPAGGLTVNLISNNTSTVSVPATVSFAPNTTSVNVIVAGVAPGSATITASAAAVASASANVTVNSARDIILPSGLSLPVGEQLRVPVTLSRPAPPGGAFVTLSSSDPSTLSITPATAFIFFQEGATTTAAQPQLLGVASGSANLSAAASGLTGDTQVVLVGSAASLLPASLTITGAGATQNLTLTLSSPAPAGGLNFTLSSSNPGVASVSASVAVPANATTASVPVTSVAPGTAVIHASLPPAFGDTTASVSVVGGGTIGLPANAIVPLGQSVAFPVTLGTPAPAGGLNVVLSSGDPSKLTVLPANVFIPAGATTPATQPQLTGVNIGTASINASAPGYTSASQTVQVNGSLSFAPSSLNLNAGATQNLTLSLSAAAPAALTVSLVSSNPGAATVPGSVTFSAGAASVSVPVTVVAQGSASITANANSPNITPASASVSVGVVSGPGAIGLPANVKIPPNQPAPFPVTLSVPAPPGGVTVTLSSNDPSVTVTPNVFVAAGAVTPMTQSQITGVAFGTATISASAPGYTSASQTVQVVGTIGFMPAALAIGTGTSNLQLNLSAAAPVGGLTVNVLSSNTGAATVPASVSFAANTTSVSVPVTGIAPGSATITASATPVGSASANVTVNSARDLILPSGVTVAPGEQVSFPLALARPAPLGGVFVSLSSSDPSKAIISPANIFIAEGLTTSVGRPQLTGISFGSAAISASAFGLAGDTQTVAVGAVLGAGTALTAKDDLQAALNAATCGKPIILQAGEVWVGNFKLPVRSDTCTVVLKSSGSLPADGIRLQSGDQAQLAILQTPNEQPVLGNAQEATHGWEFRGIEFTVVPNNKLVYDIVEFSVDNPKTFADMPNHLTFLHCTFHGRHDFKANFVRGLWPGAQFLTVRDSRFYDLHSDFLEANCVGSYNAVGDHEFANNSFICAAENVMYGSNVRLPIDGWIPSRLVFKNNFFSKDPEYFTNPEAKLLYVKNEWECKNCQDVTLNGNVFYNNHEKNQAGYAILFTPRTLGGLMPWATASNIAFNNNIIRHSVGGILMGELDDNNGGLTRAQMNPAKNITIRNNLMADLSSMYADVTHSSNYVIAFSVSAPNTVTIDHNTVHTERYGQFLNPPIDEIHCPPYKPASETFTNNFVDTPVPIVANCTGLPDALPLGAIFFGNYFPALAAGQYMPQFAVDEWLRQYSDIKTPKPGVGADLVQLGAIEAAVVAGVPVP